MTEFYYDYFSLGGVDAKKWHENFSWPVARSDTTKITIDVAAWVTEMFDKEENVFYRDCIQCSYHFVRSIPALINHCVSVNRLVGKNVDIRYSRLSRLVPWLLNQGECPLTVVEFENEVKPASRTRRLCRSIKFNYQRNCLASLFKSERVHAIGASAVYERRRVQELSSWVDIIATADIQAEYCDASVSGDDTTRAEALAAQATDWAYRYVMDNFSVQMSDWILEAFADFIASSFLSVTVAYRSLLASPRVSGIDELFTSTGGRIDIRMLSMAVRRTGGHVIGFPHGYYICHYSSPRPILHELTTVDEFVAYNENSRKLIERNIQVNNDTSRNKVTISSDSDDGLYRKWHARPIPPPPKEIRTVMLVETSICLDWAGYHAADTMVNYHFYYGLCSCLSRNGYRVLFKRRPKGLKWDSINIFKSIPSVEIVYEPFETPGVIDRADAIICNYAMSSTMFYAMCSTKVVIYVDAGWEPWFDDVYSLMQKRCRVLHSHYNERNQQCYVEAELLSLLEAPPTQPDDEFVTKYLYPS